MADLNALIAQGAQFRVPPPVDPMGNMPQLMQMRASQNQNALAQYQLSSAKREDASTNALNAAYQNAYDPATGKIDPVRLRQSLASGGAGSRIPGVEKGLMELENERLKLKELEGKIAAQPGDAAYKAAQTTEITSKTKRDELKQAISDISKFDSAADALQNLAIHERDKKISPEKAAQMRAVLSDPNLSFSKWQRSTVMGLMDEKDRVEATRPKPVATPLGNRVVYLDMNPDSPTFKQEILPSQTMGAAPSTTAALQSAAAATSNAATSAGQLKVAQDRLAQEKIGATAVPIQDPNDSSQMILVNPREYKGGGLGAPGVIGLTGKTPAATAKQEATNKGVAQVASVIDDLRANYNTLNAARAIPSTERGALSNITSSAQSSSLGQFLGRVGGTEEQSARDVINSSRLMLLNGIKQATGLSATQLNSNMELTTWLKAVSDPSQSIETVDKILGNIEKFIATGGKYSAKKDDKAGAAPAGVDPALWGAMTPEEQKLWAK